MRQLNFASLRAIKKRHCTIQTICQNLPKLFANETAVEFVKHFWCSHTCTVSSISLMGCTVAANLPTWCSMSYAMARVFIYSIWKYMLRAMYTENGNKCVFAPKLLWFKHACIHTENGSEKERKKEKKQLSIRRHHIGYGLSYSYVQWQEMKWK